MHLESTVNIGLRITPIVCSLHSACNGRIQRYTFYEHFVYLM